MNLVVGCPVRRRAWIMPSWFAHVETAAAAAHLTPHYAFVADLADPTTAVLDDFARARRDRRVTLSYRAEEGPADDERRWNPERFAHMVGLRNRLLAMVRGMRADLFLSVDSDILLHPQALVGLREGIGRFGAVGGATFMTPSGEEFPNCGWVRGSSGFSRSRMEHHGVIPVGVIMALKLMSPAAFAVDYVLHPQGEDVGWSVAAEDAGVRLGWDYRYVSKHVMSPDALDRVDPRCGF